MKDVNASENERPHCGAWFPFSRKALYSANEDIKWQSHREGKCATPDLHRRNAAAGVQGGHMKTFFGALFVMVRMRFGHNQIVHQEGKGEINAGLPLGGGILSSDHSEVVP